MSELQKLGGYVVQGSDYPTNLTLNVGSGINATVDEEAKTLTLTNPYAETVLFSGNVAFSSNIALTETYKNFEYLKITNGHGQTFNISTDLLETSSTDAIGFYSYFPGSSGNNTEFYQLMYRPVDDTTLMAVSARDTAITSAGAVTTYYNSSNYSTRTYKVVGIGRK